ncbi:hypothetical protein ACFSCX_13475 [Bacillus salitolerans]|uniref:Uncharacterized protein n=1 Tax=Bacillus salitolerans TaxID=1437434 RepID=A0ABW4LR00_9BACI
MSNSRRRPVINAERVIIHAEEVIVIEANDRRRHRKDRLFTDLAGVEDTKRNNFDDVLGIEDVDRRKRMFPW